MEFLACFDYNIIYVKGETNLVADVLSRYYENNQWDKSHNVAQYVNADVCLDPKGEDLPWDRFEESRAMRALEDVPRTSTCPQRQRQAPCRADEPVSFAIKCPVVEAIETRQCKAVDLVAHEENSPGPPAATPSRLQMDAQHDPTIGKSLSHLPDLCPRVEGDCSILEDIRKSYAKDPLCSKVLKNIRHHERFEIIDRLLYTCNCANDSVLCIPSIIQKKQCLTEIIVA